VRHAAVTIDQKTDYATRILESNGYT